MESKEALVEQRKIFFELHNKLANQPVIKFLKLKEIFEATDLRLIPSLSNTIHGKKEKFKLSKMKNAWEQMMKSNTIIMKLDHVDQKVNLNYFRLN